MQSPTAKAAALVALTCFAAYVAALAPSPYWLDSSEFAAAGFLLGVAHPPGQPLAALVGKLFALVPLGSVALRVGLASAVAGAGAAALVTLSAVEVCRRAARAAGAEMPDAVAVALVGAAAGLAFGLAPGVAFSSVRPEVYALHALLAFGAVYALLRFDDTARGGWLRVAALCLGLGLANHHFLTLLLGLAAAPFVLARRPFPSLRALAWAAAFVVAGVVVYAYLPLRAARHPLVDWGAPTTLSRFWWTVSARAFQKSLAHASGGAAPEVAAALASELAVLAPLALVGAYVLARLRGMRFVAAFLLAGAILDAAGPALVGWDDANPDAYGYLAVAVGLGAIVAAALPGALLALLQRTRLRRGIAAALAVAVLAVGLARAPGWSRARFDDTERYARALVEEAPSRALLVTSYFQTGFALWYALGVEERRPDLVHVHRHWLAYPGMLDEAKRRAPSLAPLLSDHDVVADALVVRARTQPVLVEYDLDLDPGLVARLDPQGLVDRLVPHPLAGATLDADATRAAEVRHDLALDDGEPQSHRVALWLAYLDAVRLCRLGRHDAGLRAIARARRLAGEDRMLDALEVKCR